MQHTDAIVQTNHSCGEAKASNTIIGNRVMMNLYASVTSCVIHAFVHIPERVSLAQSIQHCVES